MLRSSVSLTHSSTGNRLGITFMCLAAACYISTDVLTKLVSDELPIGQIIFLRGLIASPMIILVAVWRGDFAPISALKERTVLLRTFGDTAATVLYLTALFNMPIANSTAILQTTPLMATAGAALFLREQVGYRRWLAIVIGFIGMLIIVRPGLEGFTIYSLVALMAVAFISLRDLTTRLLPASISTSTIAVISSISVTFIGALMTVGEIWVPVSIEDMLFLAASAVFILGAYASITLAMRHGEIGVVAPFRYTIMIWAIFFQIVVFGVLPDLWSLVGTAILIVTGIYTFYREQRTAAVRERPSETSD